MQLSIPYMNTRCLVQPPQNKLSLFEMVQHAKIEVSVTFLQATSYLFLYFFISTHFIVLTTSTVLLY